MKVAAAVLLLLLGASATNAADWYPKKTLPKPIDHPVIRPKLQAADAQKIGNKAKHPPATPYS